MTVNGVRKGVVRVQGDKLCLLLGINPGTKIPLETLDMISTTPLGEMITVFDKEVMVSASMKALVDILKGKGVIED